jgi:hypothetical protein
VCVRKGVTSKNQRAARREAQLTARPHHTLSRIVAASALLFGCALDQQAAQTPANYAASAYNRSTHQLDADAVREGISPESRLQRLAAIVPQKKPRREQSGGGAPTEYPTDPSMLLGMSHKTIASLFGRPDYIDENGASVTWNYDGAECSLQIVFYVDIEAQTRHVLQYAVNDGGGVKVYDADNCLKRLRFSYDNGQL